MRLTKVKIENFKGIKALTFATEQSTIIEGANGTGKTSIADAINWLLFGKNTEDAKTFGIRPIDGAPEADTVVFAEILTNDGHAASIERRLHEKWEKPKGQAEKVFKGTETKCEINGAPVKATEFSAKITEFLGAGEDIIRLITRPDAFFKLKWEAQRSILFEMAQAPTNDEIGAQSEEMAAFLKDLDGKSLQEFKQKTAKDKKLAKQELDQIPARIEELSNTLQWEDPEATEKLDKVEKEIAELTASGTTAKADTLKNQELAREIGRRIGEISNAIFKKKREAEQAAADRASSIKKNENEKRDAQTSLDNLAAERENITDRLAKLRMDWTTESTRAFDGDGLCPYCGQPLPADKQAENLAKFNNAKADQLKLIEKNAAALKEQIEKKDAETEKTRNKIAEIDKALQELRAKEDQPADTTAEEKEMEDLQRQKAEAEAAPAADTTALEKIAELNKQRDELKKAAGAEAFNEGLKKRIEDLRTKSQDLGKHIAELEMQEYKAQEFEHLRIDATEKKINALFEGLTFKLYNYTIDGNAVETCTAQINGVDYTDANTAAKINAGLEIIEALSKYYGISAPILIDNRESITNLRQTDSQTISFKVNPEKTGIYIDYTNK